MISKSVLVLTLALFCRANAQYSVGGGYGPLLGMTPQYAGEFGFSGQGIPSGVQLGGGSRRPYGAALNVAADLTRIPASAAAAMFDAASHIAGDISEIPPSASAMVTGSRPGYGVSGNMGLALTNPEDVYGVLGNPQLGGYPGIGVQGPYGMVSNRFPTAAALHGLSALAGLAGNPSFGVGGRPGALLQGLASLAGNLAVASRPDTEAGGRPGNVLQGLSQLAGTLGLGKRPGVTGEASATGSAGKPSSKVDVEVPPSDDADVNVSIGGSAEA